METPDDALEYAAVKMFLQSAKRVRPDFELTTDTMDYVARICILVQGMPLGILLAASWVSMLSVEEIAEEIAEGIDFLESELSDLPQRHRSIRAVFDYSWDLMSEAERDVFMKLSVFRGGFTREAAQAVTGANLRTLMNLMNKSLIRRDVDSGCYEIHELLRQYGETNLKSNQIIRRDHALYFSSLVERAAPQLRLARQEHWYQVLESELENLRFALDWAVQQMQATIAIHIVSALRDFWFYQGYHVEAITWLDKVLPLADHVDIALKGRFFAAYGNLSWVVHNLKKAEKYGELSVDLLRNTNDKQYLAWALTFFLGTIGIQDGRYTEALNLSKEALLLFKELDDRAGQAQLYNIIGNAHEYAGNFEKATIAFEKCLEISRSTGEILRITIMYSNLAELALESGDYVKAFRLEREGIRLQAEIRFTYLLLHGFVSFARIIGKFGRWYEATVLLSACSVQSERHGIKIQPMHQKGLSKLYEDTHNNIDEKGYREAWEEGQSMTLDEGVQYILNIEVN